MPLSPRIGSIGSALRLCALLCAMVPGQALAWKIDLSRSVVTFSYDESGRTRSGTFGQIGGTLDYVANRIEGSRATLRVGTASLDLGDAMREGVLESPAWLDSAAHPYAEFSLDGLRPLGGNLYDAVGSLSIKGTTRPTRFTLTLEDDGREARAHGELVFDRNAFGLHDAVLETLISIGGTIRLDFDIISLREAGDRG